jgi:hypothetical protein
MKITDFKNFQEFKEAILAAKDWKKFLADAITEEMSKEATKRLEDWEAATRKELDFLPEAAENLITRISNDKWMEFLLNVIDETIQENN